MAKLGGESTELLQISGDERARAARTAMLFTEEELTRFLQIMLRTFDELNYRQEPRFHLELGLLKLVHPQRLIPLEQLLSQLPGGQLPVAAVRGAPRRPRERLPRLPLRLRRSRHPGRHHRAASPAAKRRAADRLRHPRRRNQRSPPSRPSSRTPAASLAHRARQCCMSRRRGPVGDRSRGRAGRAARACRQLDGVADRSSTSRPIRRFAAMSRAEAERIAADLEEEIASDDQPEPPASGEFVSLTDKLRDAVTQALHDKGHETASTLLRGGQWQLNDSSITVEVAVRKTMLSLTMNPEAERIARTAHPAGRQHSEARGVARRWPTSPVPPAAPVAKGSLAGTCARKSAGEAGPGALPRRGARHS